MAKTKQAEARIADPLVRKPIVDWMLADIGVDPSESESHIRAYVDAIKQIESSGGRNVTSKTSSAKGDFQWLDGVFLEDLNAAKLYYKKADLDLPAWIKEAEEHQDPRKLTSGQQDELFLIRMYRLADNDDLAKTYSGDNEAGRYIYGKYHHTNPDEATIKRMDKYLPMPELPAEPEIKPEVKAGSEPRIESELAATQMATQNGRFPEVEVTARRVDETPPPLPELQEVTPTQRGQVPIPQPRQPAPAPAPQLEPVSVPQRSGRFPEISVDAERRSGGEILEPIKVDASKIDTTYERNSQPLVVEDRRAAARSRMPKAPTKEQMRADARSRMPEVTAVSTDPDPRTGDERRFDRARDTILTGATLGAYDEVAGFLGQAFGDTPYEETVNRIRKNVADQKLASPTAAAFQEIIPGLVTGGGVAGQLLKRGVGLATASGAEAGFTGAMYGETPTERVAQAALFGTAGATLGGAIGWIASPSRRANTASKEGARTQTDDQLDDGILTQNIELAAEEKTNIIYKEDGRLQKAKITKHDNKTGSVTLERPDGKIRITQKGNIERIAVDTDDLIGQYERLQDFDNARGQYKPRRQVIDYEETVKQGRTADDPIMRDATWRDATTAGELWDGMKDGVKKWYDQKLTGADDMLIPPVYPRP